VIALRVGLAALLFDGSGRCSRRIESSPCPQGQHAPLLQLTPGARRGQQEPACCRTSTISAVGRERFDKPRPHARQPPRSVDQSPPPARVVGRRLLRRFVGVSNQNNAPTKAYARTRTPRWAPPARMNHHHSTSCHSLTSFMATLASDVQ
jgi:hypothetical protein